MENVYSPYCILLVLVGYIVLHHIYKPTIYDRKISKRNQFFGFGLIFLLSIYSIQDTDYYHYMGYMQDLKNGDDVNMEDVYYWIASFVNYHYTCFRIIVWGSALLLFHWTIKRLCLNESLVLYFFVTMFFIKFSYARASLAMIVGLLGYTFLIKPMKGKFFSYLLGVALLLSSIFFHKSAIVIIPLYILSLFRINKYTIACLFLLFPVILLFISTFGANLIMNMDATEDSLLAVGSAQSYMSAEQGKMGISAILYRTLLYSSYYICFWGIIKFLRNNYSLSNKENYLGHIVKLAFYIIAFSTIFVFDFGLNTRIIFYRFLYYSLFPLSIVLSYFHQEQFAPKLCLWAERIGYVATIYSLLYSFYTAYLQSPI